MDSGNSSLLNFRYLAVSLIPSCPRYMDRNGMESSRCLPCRSAWENDLNAKTCRKQCRHGPLSRFLRFSRRMPLAISIALNLRLTASADICLLFLEEGKNRHFWPFAPLCLLIFLTINDFQGIKSIKKLGSENLPKKTDTYKWHLYNKWYKL